MTQDYVGLSHLSLVGEPYKYLIIGLGFPNGLLIIVFYIHTHTHTHTNRAKASSFQSPHFAVPRSWFESSKERS